MKYKGLFTFLALSGCLFVYADVSRHGHDGIISPYDGEPPAVILNSTEQASIEQGVPVYKELAIRGAKRGVAVFRVNARADTVWAVIKDFELYPQWISDLQETEIYRRENGYVYVRFRASHWLRSSTVWYARHYYPSGDENWGTWTLDYNRRSDLDDSVGFWRVLPVETEPEKSDVVYSASLKLKGWVAGFLESSLVRKGLKQATQWVKQQAEAR